MTKAVILANSGVYKRFIRDNRLDPEEYRRLTSFEKVHGYVDVPLLLFRGGWDLLDDKMADYLRTHGIDVIHMADY